MYFTDPAFPYFLGFVLCAYWLLSQRGQNRLLLVASYFFYGFYEPWTIGLIATISLINYLGAIGIERYPVRKRAILNLCIFLSLALLCYFKYTMFVLENIHALIPTLKFQLQVFLPAGISFYTFQALAYTADVYFGKLQAERRPVTFFLFISYFPHLTAGPIQRSDSLLAQLQKPRIFSWDKFIRGIDLILVGLVKKLVIADNIAVYVNMIFDLKAPSTLLIAVGSFGFGIQILADFSSYTDIARGLARLMGMELALNFNHPYMAKGPSEFWQRWHISLSSCIRDYIYIPLGGSRVSKPRWVVNMMFVWFLCGLWHGASWNFVLWGLYWGGMIVIYEFLPSFPHNLFFNIVRIVNLNMIACFGWLLFRVKSLADISFYLSSKCWALNHKQVLISSSVLLIFLFHALPMIVALILEPYAERSIGQDRYKDGFRVLAYTLAGLLLAIFAAPSSSEFLYFQF